MASETGAQMQVAFIKNVVWKTTPATPTGKILRKTGFTLAADQTWLTNPEYREDGQEAPGRAGIRTAKGDLSGVLSYGTYDEFMEAALHGAWNTNVLKIGTTRTDFTFERAHKGNGMYFPFRGVVVDSFEISGKADDKVEIKFGLIAAEVGLADDATIWTATTAPGSDPIETTWTGTIKKGGATLGIVTDWTLRCANNFEEGKVCGSKSLHNLASPKRKISGSMGLYFESMDLYTDFEAENSVALQINTGDGVNDSYQFDMSDCRITKFGAPSQGEGFVTVQVEFESYVHATNTALKVTRIPGI